MTRVDDIKMEIKEAVCRGAALLDRHKPGWERLVDLDELRMSSCMLCTAGQAFEVEASKVRAREDSEYSGFDWVTDHLLPTVTQDWSDKDEVSRITEEQMWLEHYGFEVPDGALYDELQEQWVRLIRVRQRIRFEDDREDLKRMVLSAQT